MKAADLKDDIKGNCAEDRKVPIVTAPGVKPVRFDKSYMFLGPRLHSKFGVLLCVSQIDMGSLFRFCASDSVHGSMSELKQKSLCENSSFQRGLDLGFTEKNFTCR